MDQTLHTPAHSATTGELRSVSLTKRGHVWRFWWGEGDEWRVVEAVRRLAARADCPLDELDAAAVRHHVWMSGPWRAGELG
ncbi:MAG: hypothetical protein RBS39_03360 [Phycisphaerales bacterium]|nr:hypothetical protein [Phycisphaerales bacterium]